MTSRSPGQYCSVLLAVTVSLAALLLAAVVVRIGTTHPSTFNVAASVYSTAILALLSGLCARATVLFWRG